MKLGLLTSSVVALLAARGAVGIVLFQGFWWDFLNNNFDNQWADYLAELSPRLAELGIDGVWIPPTIKNPGHWVGYAPFDHYDLGDKYQKGFTGTRLGTKDELLRMVAIMHANGFDVIQGESRDVSRAKELLCASPRWLLWRRLNFKLWLNFCQGLNFVVQDMCLLITKANL